MNLEHERELLELAAKAAGIRHIKYENDYDGAYGLMQCDGIGRHTTMWDPINNDGDALRLAIELKLTIKQELERVTVHNQKHTVANSVNNDVERWEKTRRAIVRAAADIGSSK